MKREHNFSKRRHKKAKSNADSSEEMHIEDMKIAGSSDKKTTEFQPKHNNRFNNKYQKPRPTHFLSLRIDSPQIVNGVKQLQDDIIAKHPHLEPYLTPAIKSHLTLFILNLPNPESIEKAKQILTSCSELLNKHYSEQPCTVNIGGLGHFNDRVVWVGLEDSENKKKLQEFVQCMYQPFKEAGLTCEELEVPWKPHCTIMKLSKINNKHKKHNDNKNNNNSNYNNNNNNNTSNSNNTNIETNEEESQDITTKNSKTNNSEKEVAKSTFVKVHKIDKAAYEQHKAIQFGEQVFAGVELSAMAAVDPDGYYKCLHRELFSNPSSSSSSCTSYTSILSSATETASSSRPLSPSRPRSPSASPSSSSSSSPPPSSTTTTTISSSTIFTTTISNSQ